MRTGISGAVILIFCAFCASSTEAAGIPDGRRDAGIARNRTEAIFDNIMQSMPGDARAQIDSAAGAREKAGELSGNVSAPGKDIGHQIKDNELDNTLGELPAQLRERVQKAIEEIKNGNVKRAIEFKERKQELSNER